MKLHCYVRAALAVFLLLVLWACDGDSSKSTELLRVDGRVFSLERFNSELAGVLSHNPELSNAEKADLRRSYLVQVIDRELVLSEGQRLGLNLSDEEKGAALEEYRKDYPQEELEAALQSREMSLEQWKRQLWEGILIEKVHREAVYSKVTVDDAEVEAYYRKNRSEFDRPAQARARQIVVGSPEEGEWLIQLLKSGASFEQVARENSLSPDGERGGDLGFFARGEMPPEFDDAVFGLDVGGLSGLVQSQYGYHIFLLEERREAVRLSLDDVREGLRSRLLLEKEEGAYQDWLQALRSRGEIQINWSHLETGDRG